MSKQSSYHSFVDSKDSRKIQLRPKITKRLKHKELEAGKEEATAGHQPAAANNKTNPVKKKREKKTRRQRKGAGRTSARKQSAWSSHWRNPRTQHSQQQTANAGRKIGEKKQDKRKHVLWRVLWKQNVQQQQQQQQARANTTMRTYALRYRYTQQITNKRKRKQSGHRSTQQQTGGTIQPAKQKTRPDGWDSSTLHLCLALQNLINKPATRGWKNNSTRRNQNKTEHWIHETVVNGLKPVDILVVKGFEQNVVKWIR